MLAYRSDAMSSVKIKLSVARLAAAIQLNPLHHDYAIERVATLVHLQEY